MSPPPRSNPYGGASSSSRPNPYSSAPDASADPRQVEGWALMEVAVRMRNAQREPVDTTLVAETAKLNRRLWTIIQAYLLEPDCAMPEEPRTRLLTLSKFIDKRTTAVIADPNPSQLDVLIRINREIAGGLMTQPVATEAPAPTPPPPAPPSGAPGAPGPARKLTDTRA